jgi:hypothetical protein
MVPLASLVLTALARALSHGEYNLKHRAFYRAVVRYYIVIYVATRGGLVVLVFYCFSSMPASAYTAVDWSSTLPHFS